MHKDNGLYCKLNNTTATERWLEDFDLNVKRVLIGKDECNDNWSMAVSFFHGAESLRKFVLQQSGYDLFRREYPMMFLYRHSIELFLKHALMDTFRSHNLKILLDKLVHQIKEKYKIDVSESWFANEIRELSNVDPTAQGFRYSHNINGDPALASNYFVDLEDLGKRMQSLYSIFLQISLARGDFSDKGNGT